jgi:hypothetical protein
VDSQRHGSRRLEGRISNDPAMDEDWARCVQRIPDGFDPYGDGMF